jgi:hypothetical protein
VFCTDRSKGRTLDRRDPIDKAIGEPFEDGNRRPAPRPGHDDGHAPGLGSARPGQQRGPLADSSRPFLSRPFYPGD